MTDFSALIAGPGGHSLDYIDPAFPDRALRLHSACPPGCGPQTPLLFVLHGVARNGRDYRDYWAEHAEATGILAIAVEFSEAMFPEYLWYHFGNLHDGAGGANPREQWTFGIIPRLFAALRAQGVTQREKYGLFGHSAGGQFVHRMLSFGYREQVAVAVSANAGTYAMPDLAIPWPFGLGEMALDNAALGELLRFPIIVMAGMNDTRTTGKHFPGGPRSMRQGPTRWHRAHEYLRLGREAAAALGTACAWRVIDVPDVGHSGRKMSAAAVPVIAAGLR